MPDSQLIPRQVTALRDLVQISAERAKAEASGKSGYTAATEAIERAYQDSRQAIIGRFETESAEEERSYQETHKAIVDRFQADHPAAEKEYQGTRRALVGRHEKERAAAKKDLEGSKWEAASIFEAARDGAKKHFEGAGRQLAQELEHFQPIAEHAEFLLEEYRPYSPPVPAADETSPPAAADDDPFVKLQESMATADSLSAQLGKLFLPKLLRWSTYPWIVVLIALVLAYPSWVLLGTNVGLATAGIVAIVAGIGLRIWLLSVARRQVGGLAPTLAKALADVETWRQRSEEQAKATLRRQQAEAEQRREAEVRRAEEKFARRMAESEQRRDQKLRELEEQHTRTIAEIKDRYETGLRQTEERHTGRVVQIQQQRDDDSKELDEKYKLQMNTGKVAYEKAWQTATDSWRRGLERILTETRTINEESSRLFPDWSGAGREAQEPVGEIPPVIRFGEFHVNMAQVPYAIPHDERLKPLVPEGLTLPALLPFPTRGSILIKASGAGRDLAVQTLQAVMLRYLTALPPGKVRFTIIDPVGLGQNFSAFMHLADYDEQFVTSRIWTEPQQIEQKLIDLTDHMENVIQKYLRNEFETIEEYNIHAGEVAEPFRFLVIANFPVNFNDSTARRLISIANSGPRCGVYTLISVDTQLTPPQGFNIKDLEKNSINLIWKDNRFQWRGSEFEQYPLKLDVPPAPEVCTPMMHDLGKKAKEAKRVEVPFEFIAPPPDRWWTSDSSTGIDIALGRAGATRLQHLKLGKGTSQHVLIAGRTGSGKSTLLHALITNLALHYSPEEVELYLIDFKKGVEFKVYATHELAHARVVAIESEREFGLSVLQRLDAELKFRGDRFRDLGAQDLNAYRKANGDRPTPRILLIVDEFQEFFVEDDKVAQEAALLLDRLVRQGRAFGIHVHLGSQTLSGAYSLARSTLGQMAVRIALQCSEADAHLILSEENSAARLLSRPGEAIYNDANGMIEGNNFFQVVWLSDDSREDYLIRLQALARERNLTPTVPQIVFEGNKPADAAKNPLLGALIEAPAWPASPRVGQAWLGEAIAIKDPTAAVFRPQSGSNLLLIGQQDEGALGILTTALVGLAAQYPPGTSTGEAPGARFYIFDGSPVDSPFAGTLERIAEIIPHPVQVVGLRDLPAVIGQIADEVDRRQASASGDATALYLIIYDLQRFRDLRKADDDFGFSRMGEEQKPTPAKQFPNILREGPGLGVHTLVWCDTLNNVNRTLDRQSLREFEMRVLFQMSANDSSSLIDSPAANKIGPHRALFFSEEQGRLEKFRPYGVPPSEWLDRVRSQFRGRNPASDATQTSEGSPTLEAGRPVGRGKPVEDSQHLEQDAPSSVGSE